MVTITSTTYCGSVNCHGHTTVTEYPGKRLVVGSDPARPLELVDAEPEGGDPTWSDVVLRLTRRQADALLAAADHHACEWDDRELINLVAELRSGLPTELPVRLRHARPHATFGDDPSGWCGCADCDPREDCGCPTCREARR